jgi:hypothetical protein
MCIWVKLSHCLCNFGPEKAPLDVPILWQVLYVVALPIGDGLQHPYQGLHKVLQLLPPLNLVQKVILEKSLQIHIFRPYIFASFHQVLPKLLLWFRSSSNF